MNLKKYPLILAATLLSSYGLQSQSLNLQFTESGASDCNNNTYCFDMQISSSGGDANLGTSSIEFSYNAEAMILDGRLPSETVSKGSYTSINFNDQAVCGGINNAFTEHAFDAKIPGTFLMTLILNTPDKEFSCPTIGEAWTDVSTLCFEVLDADAKPELTFLSKAKGYKRAGTNFNQWVNDGKAQYEVGEFTAFNKSFNESCSTSSVGIESLSREGALVFSPNPVANLLNIAFDASAFANADVQIFDATGKAVISKAVEIAEGSNNLQFDMSGLAAGTYYLNIQDGTATVSKKFVKQ